MRFGIMSVLALAGLVWGAPAVFAQEHEHYDIAPFFVNDQLLTGGYSHSGVGYAPPMTVYGFEFGEDSFDPYNPTDPGVNQGAGLGQLPAGAPLRYNILTGLRYWDGTGLPMLTDPPAETYLSLTMGLSSRTLAGNSQAQTGSLIQTVAADGSLHKHFVTSLFAAPGTSNVPGEANYVEPPAGIYAFGLELTLTHEQTLYVSDPIWLVFNNGLSEETHDAAMSYIATRVVPEPAGLAILMLTVPLLHRRRG